MQKIKIELKQGYTGSNSPWHLAIAKELGVKLATQSDIMWYVRINDNDVYMIDNEQIINVNHELMEVEKKNHYFELGFDDAMYEVEQIVYKYGLRRCAPLDEFREELSKIKK